MQNILLLSKKIYIFPTLTIVFESTRKSYSQTVLLYSFFFHKYFIFEISPLRLVLHYYGNIEVVTQWQETIFTCFLPEN